MFSGQVKSNQMEEKSPLPVGAIAWHLAFLLGLVLLQVLWASAMRGKDVDWLNLFVPMSLGVANLLLAWKLIRTSSLAIWNPLFWLLLVCTLFYGMGQLAFPLAHPDTVQRINSLYFVNPEGLARTNLLNTVGVMTTVAAFLATSLLAKPRSRRIGSGASELFDRIGVTEARWALWVFLAIGLPIKYLLQLPYDLGLMNWVLPGSIKHLGSLSGAALVPLYWLYRTHSAWYRLPFFVLLGAELGSAVVELSKLDVVKTLLFVAIAVHLVKPNLKRLAVSGVAIFLLYALVLSPFVNFSRAVIGRAATTGLSQAMDVVELYKKSGPPVDSVYPRAQSWWVRLCYANAELFAMREYDRGRPGSTIWKAPYALIPRFLMPDKPIMTSGFEFNYLIRGHTKIDSSHGPGVFGEGYWHGGWFGVAAVGMVVGVLLAWFHRVSISIIEERRFLLLPVVLTGLLCGLRIDTWFVPTYLGGPLQALVWALAINFAVRPVFESVVRVEQNWGGPERADRPDGALGIAQESSQTSPMVQGVPSRKYPILFGKS